MFASFDNPEHVIFERCLSPCSSGMSFGRIGGLLSLKIPVLKLGSVIGRRRSGLTREQIIGMLREHQAGAPAADLCCKHGISDAMFYTRRSKYCGMEISDARKLKGLEEENARLKTPMGEATLDVSTLKEMLGKISGVRLRRMAAAWR